MIVGLKGRNNLGELIMEIIANGLIIVFGAVALAIGVMSNMLPNIVLGSLMILVGIGLEISTHHKNQEKNLINKNKSKRK